MARAALCGARSGPRLIRDLDALTDRVTAYRLVEQIGGGAMNSRLRELLANREKAGRMDSTLPAVNIAPANEQKPASFAASLKAMVDEAKAGVAQARADGLAKVKDAVGKLSEAKSAVTHVSENMAKTIEDEAASVMAELGQISNDLGGN